MIMFLKAECYDPCRKVVVLPFDGSGWDGSLTRNNQSFVGCAYLEWTQGIVELIRHFGFARALPIEKPTFTPYCAGIWLEYMCVAI